MNALFYVKYQPRLMLVDCLGMPPAAELAHRRLCDWIWSQDHLPPLAVDPLCAITRVAPADWPGVFKTLQEKGWRARRGFLAHPGVLRLLQEGKAAHATAVSNGRKGARRRWCHSRAIAGPLAAPMPRRWEEQLEKQVPAQNSNNAERLTRSASPLRKSNRAETNFMKDVQQTLQTFDPRSTQTELENWGGWWRNRFRENADKATRVLADVATLVKEHRIKVSPGAAAHDLWRRLP